MSVRPSSPASPRARLSSKITGGGSSRERARTTAVRTAVRLGLRSDSGTGRDDSNQCQTAWRHRLPAQLDEVGRKLRILHRATMWATADPETLASVRVLEKTGLANRGLTDPVETWRGCRFGIRPAALEGRWSAFQAGELRRLRFERSTRTQPPIRAPHGCSS